MPIKKNIIKTFQDLPNVINEYIKQIPDDVLDIKRNANTWTIRDHLTHIISVQELLLSRMKLIIEQESPKIEPFFPDKNKQERGEVIPLNKLIKFYKNIRKEQITLIQNLNDNILDKTAEHKEYIKYTVRLMINHMIFHEYWYMYRIEEIWLTKDAYFK